MKAKCLLMILIFLPLIGCDRYTKELAVVHLKGQERLSFFSGAFNLTYHENPGAMLSLGATLPDNIRFFIFTVLVGLVLLGGSVYVLIKPSSKAIFSAALFILAGGFGNLYDRAFNDGRVVDFMNVQFGPLRTGIFNVADVAIVVGILWYILASSRSSDDSA